MLLALLLENLLLSDSLVWTALVLSHALQIEPELCLGPLLKLLLLQLQLCEVLAVVQYYFQSPLLTVTISVVYLT